MIVSIHLRFWPQTAVFLSVFLLFTACRPIEAPPGSTPIVVTAPSEVTATRTEPIPPTLIPLPEPTAVPSEFINPTPTAVPSEFINPTPTAASNLPPLPVENSLSFSLQNQFGGVPQAVLVDGNTIYLAVGPRLVAVDVTTPDAPQFLGHSPVLGNVLRDIAQEGTLIYGAAGHSGLVVLDVSNPANIQLMNAGPNYNSSNPPNATQVAISGGRVFVGNDTSVPREYDLLWFDISVPEQPAFLAKMSLSSVEGFSTTRDWLFIATDTGIQVMDPQDPTQAIGRVGVEQKIHKVQTAVHHNLLYLLYIGQEGYFAIYDLTDSANPQVVPQDQQVFLEFLSKSASNDNVLATSSIFGGFGYCRSILTIIDITAAEAPRKTAEFDPQNCVTDMIGSGDLLYVTGRSGLQIYSTSDPSKLALLGSYTNPGGVQSVGGFLPGQPISYLLTNEGRGPFITATDLSQNLPTLLAQTEPQTNDRMFQLLAAGQTLIAPMWNSGMALFDISNPTQLTQHTVSAEESQALGSRHGMAVVDNVLYMPVQEQFGFTGHLGVFDLQDPTNPQLAHRVDTQLYSFDTLVKGDGYLYLIGNIESRKIVILDIHTPLAPTFVGSLTLSENASRLTVVGDTLYATCEGYNCNSLTVIDVGNAERPFLLNQWQLPFDIQDLVATGNRLFTISHDNTIRALDVSQPDQPKLIGSIRLPGSYGNLTTAEGALYVSANFAGLFILTADP